MKEGIHPEYKEVTIKCACGESVVTRSTKPGEIRVEICSKCHPFYTGKQKLIDAGGRVDKFKTLPSRKEQVITVSTGLRSNGLLLIGSGSAGVFYHASADLLFCQTQFHR